MRKLVSPSLESLSYLSEKLELEAAADACLDLLSARFFFSQLYALLFFTTVVKKRDYAQIKLCRTEVFGLGTKINQRYHIDIQFFKLVS